MEYKKMNVAKIVDMSKERSNKRAYLVRKVVFEFLKEGYPININSISQASGVSRQTIYKNEELKKLIEYYGKYVQRSMPLESEEEVSILMSFPDIEKLEMEVNNLLQENRILNQKILECQNELFRLENRIED